MPRLSDLTFVVRRRGAVSFGRRLIKEINDDAVLTNAAAIAYAWMFALFPFLIFLLTLIPFLPETTRVMGMETIERVLNDQLTPAAASTITANISQVVNQTNGKLLSFGLILTLYAASGGMSTVMAALDTAYEVEKPRNFFSRRLVAMTLTIFMSGCVMVILLVLPIGAAVKAWMDNQYPVLNSPPVLACFIVVRYTIGLTFMQLLVGVIYHYGTRYRNKLHFFSPGAMFTVLMWLLTSIGLRFYFSHFADYSKTYGTVAGMVVLLMIFYIDSAVLLIGAEIDSEIEAEKKDLQSAYISADAASRPHA